MTAAAAPFDSYPLIMWQEHTPAQVAGLARLGFTATMLLGGNGTLSPALIEAHRAAALPFYVENLATDFFSPYHRYRPGQPVTALFDQAKARLAADPADTEVFRRDPSLSDPVWLARIAGRLETVVAALHDDHPLFYSLADEAGIGDLAAAWDADIGPDSLAAMRNWLRTQYPDLAALNAEWGTGFPSWDAITPELTAAALTRTDGNFAAWSDFKAWMDTAFARAVRAGTDAVHRADPAALAGLEGAQLPGWGGYDFSLLAPAVDVMEVFAEADTLDLARAFNPDLIALRTSFGEGPRERHAAWRHVLHGGSGTIVWDEADTVVAPDGSPRPRGADLAATAAAIRAVAPNLLGAQPDPDPVAVLVSQPSFRITWLLDRRAERTPWTDRSAGREYAENAWRLAREQILRRLGELGVQPRLLSPAMLASGALKGVRVLILPHAIALSAAETDAIAAFARAGGTVLADTEPGLFDGHGKRRASPPLAGIAQLPEPMMQGGSADDPGLLDAQADLLTRAGAAPRLTLLGPDNQRAVGVEARWLRHGGAHLLALQAQQPYAAPATIRLAFPALTTIQDLRRPGPPQIGDAFTLALDPVEPSLLFISP